MDSTRVDKEPQSSVAPFCRLLDLPKGATCALLHSGGAGPAYLFSEPLAELRLEAAEWSGAWLELDRFLKEHGDRKCVDLKSGSLCVEPIEIVRSDFLSEKKSV